MAINIKHPLQVSSKMNNMSLNITQISCCDGIFLSCVIAVSIYRLVMISINRSETAQKSALEIWDKFSLRQNAVRDKVQSENLFLMVGKIFLLDWILSWTVLVLDSILSRTEFVLDWILSQITYGSCISYAIIQLLQFI